VGDFGEIRFQLFSRLFNISENVLTIYGGLFIIYRPGARGILGNITRSVVMMSRMNVTAIYSYL
jgi:hypothetical protein